MTTAEGWERFLEAGERFMAYMEADTARLADRLGITVEDLNYFADTMDFEWLAKRVAEAEGVKVIEPGDGHPVVRGERAHFVIIDEMQR